MLEIRFNPQKKSKRLKSGRQKSLVSPATSSKFKSVIEGTLTISSTTPKQLPDPKLSFKDVSEFSDEDK